MMASRDPKDLIPAMQPLYYDFHRMMEEAKVDYIVTCTLRSQEEQNALYDRGRIIPGPVVTWTRSSKHTIGKAFDIAVIKDGKISWSVDDYRIPGMIGEKAGLVWGGTFKTPDRPHFELAENKNGGRKNHA